MTTNTSKGAVLITGASSGIGAESAIFLDSHNYRVFAGVRRLEDGVALQQRASERLTPILLDVTKQDQITQAVVTIQESLGDDAFVGLVNNAGITVNQPLEFIPIDELRRQIEVNFIGQIAVTQAFMPCLRQSRGRIVMMSSPSGRIANPIFGPYAASKHALEAASSALRVELRSWGIHVSLIVPGSTQSAIWEKGKSDANATLESYSEEARRYYGRALKRVLNYVSNADRRSLHPRVVAQAVEHALASPRPRRRYIIGRDAYQLLALNYMPGWLRDRILGNLFGLG
jgi:NAD(P)-dependent dehydrogenase (short-subunit alcohol dehydrogenase family)